MTPILLLNLALFLAGLSLGYLLFRSERVYQQGWRDCERNERLRAFRQKINERARRVNPEARDRYDK